MVSGGLHGHRSVYIDSSMKGGKESWQAYNSKSSNVIVEDGKGGRLPMQCNPVGRDQADNGGEDDQCRVQPIDVLRPVLPGHWLVGDI